MKTILDLFCGGGGAGVGYSRAGFTVVGVDWKPQPAYPFTIHRADALEFLQAHGHEFDAIHASPPCQGYSTGIKQADSPWVWYSRGKAEPQLIADLRAVLLQLGKPYVIENVTGAEPHLVEPVLLCNSMFDAWPNRHRLFETSFPWRRPPHRKCRGRDSAYARTHGLNYRDVSVTGKSRHAGTLDLWRQLMDMHWPGLRASDLAEAVPPRYTEYIGGILFSSLQVQMEPSS